MAKRTLEVYDCDKCGKEAERYTVTFGDGTLVLDRCPDHNRKLEALRTEKGEWVTMSHLARNTFRKTSLSELRLAVQTARQRPSEGDDTEDPKGKVRGL